MVTKVGIRVYWLVRKLGDDGDLDIFVHEKMHHDKYLRFMCFTVCYSLIKKFIKINHLQIKKKLK